jgi:hypothetical protein
MEFTEMRAVWVALQRPYSFVVLASLNRDIRRTGSLEHPTDIFPRLNIPVVGVVWTDNDLLPNDMSGRELPAVASGGIQ